jgi:hypothetical protein
MAPVDLVDGADPMPLVGRASNAAGAYVAPVSTWARHEVGGFAPGYGDTLLNPHFVKWRSPFPVPELRFVARIARLVGAAASDKAQTPGFFPMCAPPSRNILAVLRHRIDIA